jgi:DNA-binding HxlR family transcriptional regulator
VARKRGLPALRLYTNAAMHENIALYSSLGWQETERRRVNGFERVFFHKRLDRVSDMLALLGTGAAGEVLLALGEEELRTEELAARIGVYSPRTIYRYLDRLVGLEVVEREEEPGVPSKVTNRLTDPRGTGLYELVCNYARVSLDHLPDGRVVTHSWSPLAGLADLWRSGMLEALNAGPRTVTELSQASPSLSFHQVGRRMGLYVAGGLLEVAEGGSRRRRYRPTECARRGMALVAGLAHWREVGEEAREGASLTAAETASMVAASLPLAALPEAAGKRFELTVKGPALNGDVEQAHLWAEVGTDGAMQSLRDGGSVDALASGGVNEWVELIALGTLDGIRIEGSENQQLEACLRVLHASLWKPAVPSP